MHTLQKCVRIIPSKDTEELPRTARGAFFVPFDRTDLLESRGLAAAGRESFHHVRKAVRSQRLRTDGGYRHHVQRSAEGLGSGDNHL